MTWYSSTVYTFILVSAAGILLRLFAFFSRVLFISSTCKNISVLIPGIPGDSQSCDVLIRAYTLLCSCTPQQWCSEMCVCVCMCVCGVCVCVCQCEGVCV